MKGRYNKEAKVLVVLSAGKLSNLYGFRPMALLLLKNNFRDKEVFGERRDEQVYKGDEAVLDVRSTYKEAILILQRILNGYLKALVLLGVVINYPFSVLFKLWVSLM